MARLFARAGFQVKSLDTKVGPIDWETAGRSDVILLAVPVPAIEQVMENLGPHTREDGVIIDIASLKESPIDSMLRHARGEVIGCHPLFGPDVDSVENQIVFVCPARANRWKTWFVSFLEQQGAKLVEIDPVRHDRLMARIQVLRHLLIFCFGRSLMRLDFDIESDMAISGPWFGQLFSMLSRQLDQVPDLYADLTRHNPSAEQVFHEFFQAAHEVTDSFAQGDRDKIGHMLAEISDFVRPFAATSTDSTGGVC